MLTNSLRRATGVVSQKFVDKVGRSPWTAADALVGLHRSTEEPDQGVRRGRWRPPHCNLFGELLTQETSTCLDKLAYRTAC
jgi:hypothetical protein